MVLVEPVPVFLLAGLAHVTRRGNGALRARGRLLDVVIQQEHDDAPDGEPHGEGNLGQETRNHAPILPDEAPVTQAMDTMGTRDEDGASPM